MQIASLGQRVNFYLAWDKSPMRSSSSKAELYLWNFYSIVYMKIPFGLILLN